jgi:hypothetical protein
VGGGGEVIVEEEVVAREEVVAGEEVVGLRRWRSPGGVGHQLEEVVARVARGGDRRRGSRLRWFRRRHLPQHGGGVFIKWKRKRSDVVQGNVVGKPQEKVL